MLNSGLISQAYQLANLSPDKLLIALKNEGKLRILVTFLINRLYSNNYAIRETSYLYYQHQDIDELKYVIFDYNINMDVTDDNSYVIEYIQHTILQDIIIWLYDYNRIYVDDDFYDFYCSNNNACDLNFGNFTHLVSFIHKYVSDKKKFDNFRQFFYAHSGSDYYGVSDNCNVVRLNDNIRYYYESTLRSWDDTNRGTLPVCISIKGPPKNRSIKISMPIAYQDRSFFAGIHSKRNVKMCPFCVRSCQASDERLIKIELKSGLEVIL